MAVPESGKGSKNDQQKDKGKQQKPNKVQKGAQGDKEAELSEEDLAVKQNLELMVERIKDVDTGVQKMALETVSKEIREATTSMTSVPKPLKFLRAHYEGLKTQYSSLPASNANRPALADVLSVLAITSGKEGERESLHYRLKGAGDDVGSWGNEYVRNLAGEIAAEFHDRQDQDKDVQELLELVRQVVPYHMRHNAEPEAVDILLEVERLDWLAEHVDDKNYNRTCLYLTSCCSYLAEPDDAAVLRSAYDIYLQRGKYPDAMRVALRLNDQQLIVGTVDACTDISTKKQLAFLMARQGVLPSYEEEAEEMQEGTQAPRLVISDNDLREELRKINSNSRLSELYLALARDLDVMEAKTPEEVYKAHLTEGRQPSGPAVDSARQNLASTFVNAFVNAGFGQDKLMTVTPEGESSESVHWIFKNKDHGKASATASLGLITLWDVEGGLPQIDKYLYSRDHHVVAGALLAVGITNCGVQDECDPAFALLCESVNHDDPGVRIGAIMGLGLAYAGTQKSDVQELLMPVVVDPDVKMDVAGFAALALGLVFASTCHGDSAEAIIQALMLRGELELGSPFAKFLALGLGLLFLGRQEAVEPTVEVARTLNERISKYTVVTLDSCAYAGTSDVLKVQQLLAQAGEHLEVEEGGAWKATHQSAAVMGIGLVAMGEDLGSAMAGRALDHLLQYGDAAVRQAVPLAVALLNVSAPKLGAMDMLSRLSHDTDLSVAQNAVVALGVIGAGTNNARLAGMLRALSSYYYKEPTMLFLVRVAQGLVHMGKGLLTLNPYHTDGQLLSGVALAGILAVLHSCLDLGATLGGSTPHHFIFYFLATAMKPRMLMTVDEELNLLTVPVRVGQAVDVVAQAGRPKAITGFQTHTTPVLLSSGERAELATQKYLPLNPVLEGIVILKPNPDYIDSAE
eukprot:jgi/Astpho2/6079/e_gw1.00084.7.1_t